MSHFEAFYQGAQIDPDGLDPKGLRDLEIGRYMARGRALQAQAIRDAAVALYHAVRGGLRRLTGLVLAPGLRETYAARATHH